MIDFEFPPQAWQRADRCSGGRARRRPKGARRRGRVLVECCVALVLLAVSSTLVLLGATGTATLVDSAIQEDRVQRAQATVAARVQRDACVGGAMLPALSFGARLSLSEAHVATDSLHFVQVLASWEASALAGFAGRSVAFSTAGVCE